MSKRSQQLHLYGKINWTFRYSHGGSLRNRRRGRKARPLSTKAPIHLVLKADRHALRKSLRSPLGFKIVTGTLKKYERRFFVKIEQTSINSDHIHLLVRIERRSLGQHFLRVVGGQIAQDFLKNGLLKVVTDTPISEPGTKAKMWKYRPFTRVIQGWKPYLLVRNYIKLNEKEASGLIAYKPHRLRGLSNSEWQLLWA